MESPSPSEIKAARKAAKLSQAKAAELIYCDVRTWQYWEKGTNAMHPAFMELFNVKVRLRQWSS